MSSILLSSSTPGNAVCTAVPRYVGLGVGLYLPSGPRRVSPAKTVSKLLTNKRVHSMINSMVHVDIDSETDVVRLFLLFRQFPFFGKGELNCDTIRIRDESDILLFM
jgi:hypothetical protein